LLVALSDAEQDVRTAASLALDGIDARAVVPRTREEIVAVIDTLTPRLMGEAHVPGVSVALIQKRSVVWSHQYGVANVMTGEAVTESTMFEACSMSKPVLAVIALRLAEQKKLDLDTPLIHYLDLPSLRGQPGHERITARMVLSHTTGLPNWRRGDDERDGPLPVNFPPGSRFGYSGEAIYYLQQVIEKITGEPIDILAGHELFTPLGLRHISYTWNEDIAGLIAGGHNAEGKYNTTTRYTHANAAYTLYTSASDYAQFIIALMHPGSHAGVLTARSTAAMFAHQVPVPAREPIERPGRARATAVHWGLGWAINSTGQGDIMHHGGSNQSGFRCFSQFDPATGSGIVIMTNGANGTEVWSRLISRIGNL
jgi:CubicO group peptidase (beta-lactamase class C family)